ncbi:transporter [Diplocloster hominis]|uniref:transporter n=1 Tax=Diplocloster hominis TaxID=3079010 RepID=UPI0031BBC2E0
MTLYYKICIAITAGIIIGFLIGSIKPIIKKQTYSEEKINYTHKLLNRLSVILKYITFLLLSLGLIWCSYFLVLGIVIPSQADYANNIAELIVSVLTVISIIFAFVEFLSRTDNKK